MALLPANFFLLTDNTSFILERHFFAKAGDFNHALFENEISSCLNLNKVRKIHEQMIASGEILKIEKKINNQGLTVAIKFKSKAAIGAYTKKISLFVSNKKFSESQFAVEDKIKKT